MHSPVTRHMLHLVPGTYHLTYIKQKADTQGPASAVACYEFWKTAANTNSSS